MSEIATVMPSSPCKARSSLEQPKPCRCLGNACRERRGAWRSGTALTLVAIRKGLPHAWQMLQNNRPFGPCRSHSQSSRHSAEVTIRRVQVTGPLTGLRPCHRTAHADGGLPDQLALLTAA